MNRKNEKAALRVTSRAAQSGKELQRPSRSPFYHNKSQNGGANRENF